MSTATQPDPAPTSDTAQTPEIRNLPARIDDGPTATGSIAAFASRSNFATAQRMAQLLSTSSIVPDSYRGEKGFPNCMVALELASRIGASVMMVMQNLYVIQGKPSWSAQFLIASINSCGKFSPLRFEEEGKKGSDDYGLRAWAIEKATGEKLRGSLITWKMVKEEGWLSKAGSKWKTMPEQMFMYRAAAFWARIYAPEVSVGMHSAEELEDIGLATGPSAGAEELNNILKRTAATAQAAADADGVSLDPKDKVEDAIVTEQRKDTAPKDRLL